MCRERGDVCGEILVSLVSLKIKDAIINKKIKNIT
jgi:hypothetical protein